MTLTIVVALAVAGSAVFVLAKILVHSIARKGERGAEPTQ
jgi:hypothetical protein